MQAQFLTLDGIDGSGKSTHLETMREWFERRGMPVLFTREPGGTPLGEELRRLLLSPDSRVGLRTETLLMFAARCQHLEDVILPALDKGIHVVSDRFTDATFAYQGGGRGIPSADIEVLENWVQGSLRPNLTLLLDVPLGVSFERITRSREKDRFEQEEAEFFARVRRAYLDRAAAHPQRYRVIDSNRSREEVRAAVEAALQAHFEAV